MLSDATQDKFDIIISKELSRISRNTELAHQIKRTLEKNKIEFLTLDNAIDTRSSTTNIFGLIAWLYSEESETISKRIKAAKKMIVKHTSQDINSLSEKLNFYKKESLKKLDLLNKEKETLNSKKVKIFELLLDETLNNQDYKLYVDTFTQKLYYLILKFQN